MASWKERFKHLKERTGHHGGKAVAGAKTTAIQAAGGAAGYVAAMVAVPHIPGNIPYKSAVLLAVIGHFARRKYHNVGAGIAGAAGFAAIMEYAQKNPGFLSSISGGGGQQQQTSGYFDSAGTAGAYDYSNAGALQQGGGASGLYDDAGALQNASGYYEEAQG